MSGESLASLVPATMFLGFLVWGLATGTIIGPGGWASKRATEPWFFWLSAAFDALMAGFFLYWAISDW